MNTEVRTQHIPASDSIPAILGNISESIEGQQFEVYILSGPIEENTDLVYLSIGDLSRSEAVASGWMSLHSSKSDISVLNSSVISEKDGAAYCHTSQMAQNREISSFDRQSLVSENEAESSEEAESVEKVSKNESFRTESVLRKSEVIYCSVEGPNMEEILTMSNLFKHYKSKFELRSQTLCKRYKLKQRACRYSKLLLGIFLGYFLPNLCNLSSEPHSIIEICSIYNDKSYYEGDCISEIPSGRGTIIYSDGTTYIGDFIDGLKTGQGFIRFASGATYRGDLCNDVISGKGVYEQNGNRYEGIFVDNKLEGSGNYLLTTGESYTGEFKSSLKHGQGKLTNPSGDIYEGSFQDDVKHGYGIMKYASGEVYEGNWDENRRNGNGKMTWKDGRYWNGKWKNDERSFWGEWGKIH